MSNISENHQFIVEGEIQSVFGFYKFYFANLQFYSNQETCFKYCNQYFKNLFGYDRYDDFSQFRGEIHGLPIRLKSQQVQVKVSEQSSSIEIMERDYLLAWFKSKGFNSWTSFKALVMHYYPLTLENQLYSFWKSESIVPEVMKNVGYVKQIIGE